MIKIYSLLQQLYVTDNRTDDDFRKKDRELTAGIKNGTREAFDQAFALFNEPLYRFAYRRLRNEENALDTVQDAFVRLLGYRDRLDEKKGIKTLLFTITGNLCLDLIRKNSRRKNSSLEEKEAVQFFQVEDNRHTPDRGIFEQELTKAINQAIEHLPDKLRHALLLKQEGQMTFTELGESLGISDRYAKKIIRRALDQMAVYLKKAGYAEIEGRDI